jgi:hypothetical protein
MSQGDIGKDALQVAEAAKFAKAPALAHWPSVICKRAVVRASLQACSVPFTRLFARSKSLAPMNSIVKIKRGPVGDAGD